MKNKSFIGELLDFLLAKKAWWMVPIVIMVCFAIALIIFGQVGGVVSPFVYALF